MFDIDRLERLDYLFSVTLRGLECHFEDDMPSEDYVINSLMALHENLHSIVSDYNKELEDKRMDTENEIPEKYQLGACELDELRNTYMKDDNLSADNLFYLITATYEKGFKRGRISTY